MNKWICCQIGARQHYSVPFSLYQHRSLHSVITDVWFAPDTLPARLNRNLAGRFHPGLKDVPVYALNGRALAFEVAAYLRGLRGWKLMETRNKWFQQHAIAIMARHHKNLAGRTLHSFSYATLHLFEF